MNHKILKTSDFNVVRDLLNGSDQDSLIVFDVDEVLLTASDQVIKHKHYFNEKASTLGGITHSELWDLLSIIFLQRKAKLVNEEFVLLIRELQSRKVKAMALTNCYTERFGQINSMKNWRLDELKLLGYHSDRSWEGIPEKRFEHLLAEEAGTFPTFKQGVIFTNNISKGKALEAFLDYILYKPRRIIFIDDRLDYVESVREFTMEASISFLGIHYTATEIDASLGLCERRAAVQFEVLLKERRWLSDEEADKRIACP